MSVVMTPTTFALAPPKAIAVKESVCCQGTGQGCQRRWSKEGGEEPHRGDAVSESGRDRRSKEKEQQSRASVEARGSRTFQKEISKEGMFGS
jgi:hypothetical protein